MIEVMMTHEEKDLLDYVYGKLQDIEDYCEKNGFEKVRIYADVKQEGSFDQSTKPGKSVTCITHEGDKEYALYRMSGVKFSYGKYEYRREQSE